jgi:ABC-type thiamin/hydroxymethylpyrimidine transport system permease subunit
MAHRSYTFSTRDLLMMAALAALGGVTGTYVNALGDVTQSFLGFAGTTQWAAGLHVLWLVLAAGLTGKQGAGTITGALKGAVELLTGNTHGLLVVLVDVVAGILVDVGLLPFKKKDGLPACALAGGLASASNVFVFQLFASLPADVLSYGAILLVGAVAFISGVVFAGVLGYLLLNTLRRSGVVKTQPPQPMDRRIYGVFVASTVILTVALALFLRQALQGPAAVQVGGAVVSPYDFPTEHGDIPQTTAEVSLRGATSRYTGYPLREIIERADPQPGADLLLLRASDGYAFFITLEELAANDSLLLAPGGQGEEASFDVVGPESPKAWVRQISELIVIRSTPLPIEGALDNPQPYAPADWQLDMDSISLDLGQGAKKLQGVPLGKVLAALEPQPDAREVVLETVDGGQVTLPLADVLAGDDIRLFTVLNEETMSFAVARMSGEVLAPQVLRIEVR